MLEFNVRGQSLTRFNSFQPAEKSVGYLKAKFNFLTDEWENVDTITLRAKNKADIIIHEADVVDGIATVPWEALDRSGSFMLSLFARAGDVEITTSSVEIELSPTLDSGISSKPPTPTELDEIRDDIKDLRDQIENMDNTVNEDELKTAVETALEEAKESGEFDGPKGDKGDPGKDGYTPVKGVDYFDGQDGAPGEDGKSAYQYALDSGYTGTEEEFAEKMAEEGCSGGMTVTDDGNGNVTIETNGEAGGASDPGSGNPNAVLYTPQTPTPEQQKQARDNVGAWPVIDVVELPTENIREDCFYRKIEFCKISIGANLSDEFIIHIVDELPETGEPITTDGESFVVYFNISDKNGYGYVPDSGWHMLSAMVGQSGLQWGGTFTTAEYLYRLENDMLSENSAYIVYAGRIYGLGLENFECIDPLVFQGEGNRSVSIGHRLNVASGEDAVACGGETGAYGDGSFSCGRGTSAVGNFSFAGGRDTIASGFTSAAFGCMTHAVGDSQFVIGDGNIPDTAVTSPDGLNDRGKYIFIVGNGNGMAYQKVLSNAHTLDWDGNAWYAGSVEGTALILKSPNGTRFRITVSDDGVLSATAV